MEGQVRGAGSARCAAAASLEDENSRQKRLVADLSLDKEMLKAVIAKKRPGLVDRRTDANWLRTQYGASERRVCGLLGIAVSSYRYHSRRSDESLREQLVLLAREKPRYGYSEVASAGGARG
jgi:hypothetical protein